MDVQQTIESLLSSQAQLCAGQQKQAEAHSRLQELVQNLIGVTSQLATDLEKTVAEAQKNTDEKVATLTDNMNALIKVVDDVVRRNGHKAGDQPSL